MSKAGLIVNPRSGGESGKGMRLVRMLKSKPQVLVRVLDEFHQLSAILQEFADAGVTDIFISSGDGTIQAIQTELAEGKMFPVLPRLGLLSHGTTNMTAADLGFQLKSLEAQAAFLCDPQPRIAKQRPTLRAVNPKDGQPRHGMFLGTGAVAEGTLLCQQKFNANGLRGEKAVFLTILGAVARALFTRPNPHDQTRLDRPFVIRADMDGVAFGSDSELLLIATTLEKLILNTKPFWGGKSGPIRASLVPYPLPSVLRWILPVMYGEEDRKVPPGASSRSGTTLSIRTNSYFVIDGEFFEPPENEPLRVETGPVFTYVCG